MEQSRPSETPEPTTRPRLTTTITPAEASLSIGYRTLVKRSRYAQIEAELDKLKSRLSNLDEEGIGGMELSKDLMIDKSTDTNFEYIGNDRLGQTLLNIEDDIHRILYILLKQYEMFNQMPIVFNSSKAILPRPESKTRRTSTPKKLTSTHDAGIQVRPQSKTKSQPDLPTYDPTPIREESSIPKFAQQSQHQDGGNLEVHGTKMHKYVHDKPRSKSGEYIRPKSPNRFDGRPIYHCHYHVTKPDIHWILGTSPTTSHSLMARKQSKLSKLKQHGPLCYKTNVPLATDMDASNERSKIINRIHTMINELQQEYDRLYRQLQFQQTFGSKTDGEEPKEISDLSDHLVHIMNHLYDLHQLNKSFLC